jgi:hypothetical protein
MKKLLFCIVLFSPFLLSAQSETVVALQKKFDDSFSLFFYKNTLRMLNQADNKDFDDLVKNIEKMRFMTISKSDNKFGTTDYKNLVRDYKTEGYEEIMTSRVDGRTCNVYLKDKKGSTLGTVVLVSDSTNLYVLDILGTIDISKAGSLFSALDGNSEIARKLKSFATKDDKNPPVGKKGRIHIE